MSSEGRFRFSLLLALAVLCGATPGFAQTGGDVRVFVLDGQGTPIPGVEVTLIKAGGQSQKKPSDTEGRVEFAGLDGGVYIATSAPEGYLEVTCPGVRVVGQSRQLEIRLRPQDGPEPSTCQVVQSP